MEILKLDPIQRRALLTATEAEQRDVLQYAYRLAIRMFLKDLQNMRSAGMQEDSLVPWAVNRIMLMSDKLKQETSMLTITRPPFYVFMRDVIHSFPDAAPHIRAVASKLNSYRG